MADRRIILPYPHTGQQYVRSNARRMNWISAGRRWRKTTLFMAIAVEALLAGKRVLWGAPTYDQVRIGWDETKHACGSSAIFKESEKTCTIPGCAGRITFRSLDDPDNARGHTADLVIIDEAADVAEAAWYEVLRAMLIDTGGEAWIGGTPKGRNWFWRECVSAVDRADSVFFNAPTLGVEITKQGLMRVEHPLENPNVAFTEIEQMWRTLPERVFRQEILAEFIEDTGGVFRGVSDCVDANLREEPPNESYGYTMGVDLARVNDFSVICVLDDLGRQVYFERFNEISWSRQVEAVARVAKRYRPHMVVDKTGLGEPVVEQIKSAVWKSDPHGTTEIEGLVLTNQGKEAMIDGLALAIESGRIMLQDISTQTAELQAYQYELTPRRNVRMSAPQGMHDDCVIALALAYSRCPLMRMDTKRRKSVEDEDMIESGSRGRASRYY